MLKKFTLLTAFAATLGLAGSAQAAEDSFLFGAPQKSQIFGSTGYSGVLRGGYATGLSPTVGIGAELILDLGLFNSLATGAPGTITFAAGVPIKFLVFEGKQVVMGYTFEPGLGINSQSFGFGPFSQSTERFVLMLHNSFNIGYKASRLVTVGGGGDVPLTLFLGDQSFAVIPILLGPVAEFNISPDFTVNGELKFGPHIAAGQGSAVNFGFKFNVGVAYRF